MLGLLAAPCPVNPRRPAGHRAAEGRPGQYKCRAYGVDTPGREWSVLANPASWRDGRLLDVANWQTLRPGLECGQEES